LTSEDDTVNRIFMLGWDGATFDLIRPWAAAGKLPHIARLMESGAHGPLRSTLPPWTFPAWTSFMTGKNPGKHGIFDFFRARPGSYELEFVNGGHRRGASFWKVLSDAGRPVVSISLPCTYPPEPVNGVMISGFDFPGEGPGSDVDPSGMYPRALYDELLKNVGRHPIDSSIIKEINRGEFDVVMERMLGTIRRKAATAQYLLRSRPWDCFMILFGESDGAGHQFWKFHDPASPLFVDQPAMRDSILRIYQELDRQAGALLALLPPDTTVMMMSDHGFGGVSDWVIYPNCWLLEQGFARFRGAGTRRLSRVLDALKLWGVSTLPAAVQRVLYRAAVRSLGRFESKVRFALIDWQGTEAYFEENPYYPAVRINLKGRQPEGIVEPGAPYERVRDRLIAALEAWRHPVTGAPIVERAFRREDVYDGSCLENAPDVVVKWALHEGYSYSFRASSKSQHLAWIEQVDPLRPEHQQFYLNKSGNHRDDGIFLAQGPMIRPGFHVEGARIIDLAPTILHLLGVPVPDDMDGQVLEPILDDGFRREHALVSQAAAPAPAQDETASGAYSAEEEEQVNERLKALGYID
jgi:predicted AlkP superfamily phosphohydrolase/phosphomutase